MTIKITSKMSSTYIFGKVLSLQYLFNKIVVEKKQKLDFD